MSEKNFVNGIPVEGGLDLISARFSAVVMEALDSERSSRSDDREEFDLLIPAKAVVIGMTFADTSSNDWRALLTN